MSAIAAPLLIQVALTLVLYVILVTSRVAQTATDPEVKKAVLAGSKEKYARTPQLIAQNVANQFELPVLFYAAVAVAIGANLVTPALVTAAWVFAISRLVHAAIHCTFNFVPLRAGVFGIGLFAVVFMWWHLGGMMLGGAA
ncbi:MAPEG family protein [Parvularcula lutaonensis]|uniref:MAPEG family protein n=1 Tax=Parvularcula lutaonensis TaxID=491923 RepID=A0ABV7MAY2_9PROT|nr:MAPEG family protein [Parvularcula lutaonensis]GGY39263.1 membrane protein [Parvularcula lutaonensis]